MLDPVFLRPKFPLEFLMALKISSLGFGDVGVVGVTGLELRELFATGVDFSFSEFKLGIVRPWDGGGGGGGMPLAFFCEFTDSIGIVFVATETGFVGAELRLTACCWPITDMYVEVTESLLVLLADRKSVV